MKNHEKQDALRAAIIAAGSLSELARRIGVTAQAVSRWQRVPADRCLAVERASGISRHKLRPDIYGPEPRRPLRRRPKAELRSLSAA